MLGGPQHQGPHAPVHDPTNVATAYQTHAVNMYDCLAAAFLHFLFFWAMCELVARQVPHLTAGCCVMHSSCETLLSPQPLHHML